LRRAADFEALRARGRRVQEGFFTATLRVNELGHARLGLAIAVKIAGNAGERNRIRRVIRESFRLRQPELPAVDIVVGARPQVRAVENAALRAALVGLWRKVTAACAASRKS
jgi:ribonuclease P protein component